MTHRVIHCDDRADIMRDFSRWEAGGWSAFHIGSVDRRGLDKIVLSEF